MKETKFLNMACRHCRYYQSEGRRGGSCQKLGGVSVDSNWEACTLSCSPFDRALTNLETTLTTLEEIVHLETAFSLPSKSDNKNYSQKVNSYNQEPIASQKGSFK